MDVALGQIGIALGCTVWNHGFAVRKRTKDMVEVFIMNLYLGIIWPWLSNDPGVCLSCAASLSCSWSRKWGPCYCKGWGLCCQWLTRHCAGMLFVWRCTETHCTFTNKHTQTVYCRHVIHKREAEILNTTHTEMPKHTHAGTHIPCNKGLTVCWKDELPALCYQDDSSDSNQWKQDERPYQRRRMQTWSVSQNKKKRRRLTRLDEEDMEPIAAQLIF